jgi:glutamine cyclotransferase
VPPKINRTYPSWRGLLLVASAAGGLTACASKDAFPDFTVVRRFPHDTTAYTQGLVYANGQLYESTGLAGRSQLRRLDLATGTVQAGVTLAPNQFGEGLALLGGRLYQLTWKNHVGYVYDAATLARVDSFSYTGEGWGLATDGKSLIMSDGTDTLRFLDPKTFTVQRRLVVSDKGSALPALNELEYVRGELFANIYTGDWIVRIDPHTGSVTQWIDCHDLLPADKRSPSTDVLNGIAFDSTTGNLLITGKLWPTLYEIRLKPAESRH